MRADASICPFFSFEALVYAPAGFHFAFLAHIDASTLRYALIHAATRF